MSIELSPVHLLDPCLNVPPERLRDQIRPSTSKLRDSDRVARSNPAALHKILQPPISRTHERFCWRPPLWNTRDHKPCTSIYDRHVLHVMNRKLDPASQDLLIDILVDYFSLFEIEHTPILSCIPCALDYLHVTSHAIAFLLCQAHY